MAKQSFSQCPGECYDDFYNVSQETLSVDIEGMYTKWKESQPEFFEVTCRLKEGGKEYRHRFETIELALTMALMMVKNGCWVIESIQAKR